MTLQNTLQVLVHRDPISCCCSGKPEEMPMEQGRDPTTNSTHL